jgi:phosphoribosyl 1,2-cyclic phosphate phosphodiesterase
MKLTVLGCGSSMGVPSAGNFWGRCDPAEPKNERSRASVLVEHDGTRLLVDATYDLRYQLNRHKVTDIDALLLSHAHSDHVSGIDDLRGIAFRSEKRIDTYSNAATFADLRIRMPYVFDGDGEVYVPFIVSHEIAENGKFRAGNIDVVSFAQDHKVCTSLGFRFGDIAYSVDVVDLNDAALHALRGVKTWIVDGGAYHRDHLTTHANLKRVLGWAEILKPKMVYLTVLTSHMDYKTLCDELPPHVRPAYDGLVVGEGNEG